MQALFDQLSRQRQRGQFTLGFSELPATIYVLCSSSWNWINQLYNIQPFVPSNNLISKGSWNAMDQSSGLLGCSEHWAVGRPRVSHVSICELFCKQVVPWWCLLIYISGFEQMLHSSDYHFWHCHVASTAWKARCPFFWALSKVPPLLVTGYCTSTILGSLRVLTAFHRYLYYFRHFYA